MSDQNGLKLECPECTFRLKIGRNLIGKRVRCPNCHSVFEAQPSVYITEKPPRAGTGNLEKPIKADKWKKLRRGYYFYRSGYFFLMVGLLAFPLFQIATSSNLGLPSIVMGVSGIILGVVACLVSALFLLISFFLIINNLPNNSSSLNYLLGEILSFLTAVFIIILGPRVIQLENHEDKLFSFLVVELSLAGYSLSRFLFSQHLISVFLALEDENACKKAKLFRKFLVLSLLITLFVGLIQFLASNASYSLTAGAIARQLFLGFVCLVVVYVVWEFFLFGAAREAISGFLRNLPGGIGSQKTKNKPKKAIKNSSTDFKPI